MNRTNIEFCDYTWNPIVGCRIGCLYCWAKRMHRRFNKDHFEDPTLFPKRLLEPYRLKKPAKIFVCSMGDFFSPGIPVVWRDAVLNVVSDNPRHTFMFVTKRPEMYRQFNFPENAWLGTSVDYQTVAARRIGDLLSCGCKYTRFVLVEPLLSSMDGVDFSEIDLLFVGAQTGPGAVIPRPEWIKSIRHPNICWKENIKKYM